MNVLVPATTLAARLTLGELVALVVAVGIFLVLVGVVVAAFTGEAPTRRLAVLLGVLLGRHSGTEPPKHDRPRPNPGP